MEERTILIVEDNRDDEALILRAFEKNKIKSNLFIARDGAEALDWLFRKGVYKDRADEKLPVLIIMDLKLPKINGLEVLKEIRTNNKTKLLPIVILTTSVEESDILESYKLQANSYIKKPVDFNQFSNVVKSLSHYWLELNQNLPAMDYSSPEMQKCRMN
ncbi:MAG: response regulator [Rhodothermaceae bacterium]